MSAVECQAGGHSHPGAFKTEGGRLIKRTEHTESVFYAETLPTVVGLAAFCPKCFGVVEEGGEFFVLMEDLCHGFAKPSVADIKMGRTSVGEDNSEERRRERMEVEPKTTMGQLGMRFIGKVVYDPKEGKYTKYDKKWGYALQEAQFNSSLLHFFQHKDPKVTLFLLQSAVRQVAAILEWFKNQNSFIFLRSSLLFVFDGANPTELRVKMIDFAHVIPIREESGRDENYLFGLRELLSRLRSLTRSLSA